MAQFTNKMVVQHYHNINKDLADGFSNDELVKVIKQSL
jgi:hypothetical protein